MVTLGIGLMLYEAANQASSITGGVDGLSGVEMGKMFGVFAFGLNGKTAYLYSLAVLFVVFCFARTLVRSPFGLSLRGIREGERRMPAIGASVHAQADRDLHDRRRRSPASPARCSRRRRSSSASTRWAFRARPN